MNPAAAVERGAGDSELSDLPVTYIRPSRGWRSLDLRELWQYRELLYFLVWRDIKVRYKQTALGASWAIIQPFFTMVVFSLFFGRLAGVPSDGVPYPIFSFAALVPWTFFANGLTNSANNLVGSQNLLKKVYFPRLAIPTATVLAGAVDFALAFVVLLGMMLFYGIVPTANVLWLVPLLVLALVTSLGVGLWFSALNVQYRDVRYIVPFLVQIWLFTTRNEALRRERLADSEGEVPHLRCPHLRPGTSGTGDFHAIEPLVPVPRRPELNSTASTPPSRACPRAAGEP
jgi:ABC-type polysaccharide/polyol phosphate export permease